MFKCRYIALFIFTLVLAGCSAPTLQVKLNSAKQLNPDPQNRSLPVMVVIYQLRDDQSFKQATFQELWQHDREALAGSILSRREVTIPPNSHLNVKMTRNKEAAYVGVLAVYRHPSGGKWRAVKRIGRHIGGSTVTVSLKGNRVSIK
ncbi:MAG: type VI secretion system lipoprotein TssJ [Coxiellaceae bacterium]|nr:MAG: type VI secretion system lipoprotein TssJ [Coxiellaceae bacterium]